MALRAACGLLTLVFAALPIMAQTRPATAPATMPTTIPTTLPTTLPAARPLVHLPPGVDKVTLPLSRAGGFVLVQVKVSGNNAGWFVVETDSDTTLIDADLARELKLRRVATLPGASTAVVELPEMSIGELSIKKDLAIATRMAGESSVIGCRICGSIGNSLFRDLPFTVDYRAGTLTIHERSRFAPPPGAREEQLQDNRPLVRGSVNGYAAWFMVGLGGHSKLELPRLFVDLKSDLVDGRHWYTTAPGGLTYTAMESLDVLGRKFQGVDAACTGNSGAGRGGRPFGRISSPLLRDARLTFDYANRRMWVEWLEREDMEGALKRYQSLAPRDLAGRTPLMRAICDERTDVALAMIQKGADAQAADRIDQTALMLASERGQAEVVGALLAEGAKADAQAVIRAETALIMAAQRGHLDAVKALLGGGANANLANTLGRTALYQAAAANWTEVAEALLKHGAKPDVMTKNGDTPLFSAALAGNWRVVGLLLKNGAPADQPIAWGDTPLAAAAYGGDVNTLRLLLAQGAEINRAGRDGGTALIRAATQHNPEAIRFLLTKGADPQVRSARGQAMDVALASDRWDVCQELLLSGAIAGPTTAPSTRPIRRPVVRLPEGKETATVPLTRAGHVLLLKAKIGTEDAGWFLLDTGAWSVVLDKSLVERLKLPTLGQSTLRTPAGQIGVQAVEVRDLALGDVMMPRTVAASADLKAVCDTVGVRVAGVIGVAALREMPITIDFRAPSMTFHRPDRLSALPGTRIPLEAVAGGSLVMPATVEGVREWFTLDSGMDGTMLLRSAFGRFHPEALRGKRQSNITLQTAATAMGMRQMRLDRAEFAGRTFQPLSNVYVLNLSGSRDPNDAAGQLGMPLLHDARLTINCARKAAWVEWLPPESADAMAARLGDPAGKDLAGTTPLMRAIREGRMDVARAYIERGTDVNAATVRGLTALTLAAQNGEMDLVRILLDKGAKPSQERDTVLAKTAQCGNAAMVRMVLERTDAAAVGGEVGGGAVWQAVYGDWQEILEILLTAGARADFAEIDGSTPLMTASWHGRAQIAENLLRHGAPVDQKTRTGQTALMMAALADQDQGDVPRIAALLIARGADVNHKDSRGQTPLMLAAMTNNVTVARVLLASGADRAASGRDGTAMDIAVLAGSMDVLRLLVFGE